MKDQTHLTIALTFDLLLAAVAVVAFVWRWV